jgi:hypothetical protein
MLILLVITPPGQTVVLTFPMISPWPTGCVGGVKHRIGLGSLETRSPVWILGRMTEPHSA